MKLYPRSRLRNMLSGGMNPYNRDLYATNGFQLPVTNTNASVKWVEDRDGTLVQSPAGYPAMPGCRLATTVAEGAQLGPELVVNGGFDAGTTGWLPTDAKASLSWDSDGKAIMQRATVGAWSIVSQTLPVGSCEVGASYHVCVDYEIVSLGTGPVFCAYLAVWDIDVSRKTWFFATEVGQSGHLQFQYVAKNDNPMIWLVIHYADQYGQVVKWDNVSIKKVIPTWIPNKLNYYDVPLLVATTGDSIEAGNNSAYPYYAPVYSTVNYGNIESEIMYRLTQLLPDPRLLTYQNHALGSQTFAWVASTGAVSAIASGAQIIIIHCGTNDAYAGRTWAQVEADLNTVVGLLSDGQVLCVDEILPRSGTDELSAIIRTWNVNLATWCTANSAILIACHDAMGQIRISTGEIDDLKPEYSHGGLHLSSAGVGAMAAIRLAAIESALMPMSNMLARTPLFTTKQLIWTPQGSVQEFDETYPGVLVEPAATNKCTCRKVNPTDTTNFIKAGDAASVLAVVDDATALATAKRSNICTSGDVYELDNSAGSANAYAIIVGAVGNTNAHSFRALCRAVAGTGYLYMYTIAGMPEISSAAYADVQKLNHTPTGAVATIGIAANAGAVVRFIMPELIEAPFLGTPVMPKPTEDGLSTVTRLADPVSFATPAWLLQRPNDFAVIQRCIPAAVQDAKHLLSSYTDASNELSLILSTSAVTFRKRAGGTSTDTAVTYTHVAATLFEVMAYSTAALGTGIALRSHNGTAWSDWSAWTTNDAAGAKASAVIAATTRIGSQTDSAGHIYGSMPMTRILRIPTNLSAVALQAWLVAKAGE